MKDLKKESLKLFTKNNIKSLTLMLFIKTFFNITRTFLLFLTLYSLLSYKIPENSPFYPILYTISIPKNLNYLSLKITLISLLIFSFFAFIPLHFGIYLWFSQLKKDSKTSILTIFHYYKSSKLFIKSIFFKLALTLKSLFNFIICFAPTVGTLLFCCTNLDSFPNEIQFLSRILILASIFTILIATFFFLKLQISQPITKFLFVQNSSKNIFSIIKSADFLLHQNSKDFKQFLRSLWKYIPLCIFVIPIPFVFAYFRVCFFEFAKKIVYKQNQGIVAIPLTEKVIDINL